MDYFSGLLIFSWTLYKADISIKRTPLYRGGSKLGNLERTYFLNVPRVDVFPILKENQASNKGGRGGEGEYYLENRKKCSIFEKSTQFVCISSRGSWKKGTNFFTFRALLLYVVPKTFIELSLFQETTRPYSNKPPLSQKYPGSAPESYLLYQFYVLPKKTNFLWTTLDKFSRKVLLGKTWLNLVTIMIKRLQTNSQN